MGKVANLLQPLMNVGRLNLTARTEPPTSCVSSSQVWAFPGWMEAEAAEVCETSLLAFILSKRFQLLCVFAPPELNSSGEKDSLHVNRRDLSHVSCAPAFSHGASRKN